MFHLLGLTASLSSQRGTSLARPFACSLTVSFPLLPGQSCFLTAFRTSRLDSLSQGRAAGTHDIHWARTRTQLPAQRPARRPAACLGRAPRTELAAGPAGRARRRPGRLELGARTALGRRARLARAGEGVGARGVAGRLRRRREASTTRRSGYSLFLEKSAEGPFLT